LFTLKAQAFFGLLHLLTSIVFFLAVKNLPTMLQVPQLVKVCSFVDVADLPNFLWVDVDLHVIVEVNIRVSDKISEFTAMQGLKVTNYKIRFFLGKIKLN
jgi:hypothetical protein